MTDKISVNCQGKLTDATYLLKGQPEDMTAKKVAAMLSKVVIAHKVLNKEPDVTAQTLVAEIADAWFELDPVPEE
jgi:uroporphyrinogen-III decarboxylase